MARPVGQSILVIVAASCCAFLAFEVGRVVHEVAGKDALGPVWIPGLGLAAGFILLVAAGAMAQRKDVALLLSPLAAAVIAVREAFLAASNHWEEDWSMVIFVLFGVPSIVAVATGALGERWLKARRGRASAAPPAGPT